MDVFLSEDYKAILRETLLEKRKYVSKYYTFQKMADTCKVEKAYMSRVFNGDAHLSSDQLFLACSFLGFSQIERRYIHLLQTYQRSGVKTHKDDLLEQIREIQQRNQKTDSHISTQVIAANSMEMSSYFLDPNAQLVHMFLTTTKYGHDLKAIGKMLHLTEGSMCDIIALLERLKLVKLKGGRYVTNKKDFHLPSDSALYKAYRLGVRMRSQERLQNTTASTKNYSFSVIFSSNEEIRRKIHSEFLHLVGRIEKWVKAGTEEDVYQMNFDLVNWSDVS